MTETAFHPSVIILIVMGLLGMGIGAVYFIALWKTVSHIPQAHHPVLLTFGSFLGRMIITIGIFTLIAIGGHWDRLLACLVGFILSRIVLVRHYRHFGPEEEQRAEHKESR
jgi:F1F0 ATPase subunit 2